MKPISINLARVPCNDQHRRFEILNRSALIKLQGDSWQIHCITHAVNVIAAFMPPKQTLSTDIQPIFAQTYRTLWALQTRESFGWTQKKGFNLARCDRQTHGEKKMSRITLSWCALKFEINTNNNRVPFRSQCTTAVLPMKRISFFSFYISCVRSNFYFVSLSPVIRIAQHCIWICTHIIYLWNKCTHAFLVYSLLPSRSHLRITWLAWTLCSVCFIVFRACVCLCIYRKRDDVDACVCVYCFQRIIFYIII